MPRISDHWNGNIWKIIFEILNSKNLIFKIVDCDNGIGILKKKDMYEYNKNDMDLDKKNYNYFVENFEKLPVIDFEKSLEFLDNQHIDGK